MAGLIGDGDGFRRDVYRSIPTGLPEKLCHRAGGQADPASCGTYGDAVGLAASGATGWRPNQGVPFASGTTRRYRVFGIPTPLGLGRTRGHDNA